MFESYVSVSQINTYLKNIFEAEIMLQNICVFGEVGSFNISNGNAYFNLKDESGILPCVLFGASRFDVPNIGDMVLVKGSMSYYAKGGKLSFNAVSIMPYGKGLLYEKFLMLKNELESRGYFNIERKKQIPERVRRIGVVSSQTGAVIRDIIDVTTRRNDTIDIVLYPVKVQGVGADRDIASGIDFFSGYDVDIVIVARGGGSMEDLEPFNSEVVATATYNCQKPIVSAVGHETDFTIIDFVADLRAPTPSAAAELVAWDKRLLYENIYSYIHIFDRIILNKLDGYKNTINKYFDKYSYYIDNAVFKYANNIDKQILKMNSINLLLEKYTNRIDKLKLLLDNYNPIKISNMGYSKVLKDNKIITSKKQVNAGDNLCISLIDGNIGAEVKG